MSQQDSQLSDEIDGFKYRVYMLDPLIAADIIADLGFLFAPIIGSIGGVAAKERGDLIGSIMGSDEIEGLEGMEEHDLSGSSIDSAIERAVMGFFGRFSKAKQRELFNLLIPMTRIVDLEDSSEPKLSANFTSHFRGRPKAMYLWFAFAMRAQFKDFFSGLEGAMKAALKKRTPDQQPDR